jgi:UDP-N-acetylmuramoylalanine--D-glutamate ligase
MELRGRRIVVIGLGSSGVAAARLCLRRGAQVVAADQLGLGEWSAAARKLADEGAELAPGTDQPEALATADLGIVSPGVRPNLAMAAAEARGCPVVSELELASWFLLDPVVLVGGTNGKSTVTGLVGAMLAATGSRVFIGGNYGTPLSDAVGSRWDALVVEISSFQAERVPTLHARVHVLLNVTEDHLDRYPTFDDYAHAKGNPFAVMGEGDVAVIPAGDTRCAAQAHRGRARIVTFGLGPEPADVRVRGSVIEELRRGFAIPTSIVPLAGRHNLANSCAAVAAASAMGAGEAAIRQALASFRGLPHRMVLVAEQGGVRFYDDSKGTNVGATVAALDGLAEPRAVLIAGGRDKQGSYEPLVEALRRRGRGLVLLGEAAPRIAAVAQGVVPLWRAADLREAVRLARGAAEPGDAVLLSPACSSYDMFRDYRERGAAFLAAVRAELEGLP